MWAGVMAVFIDTGAFMAYRKNKILPPVGFS
ncbi:MAG: hypothetical protein C5S41_07455 [Candidatus Methanomarinus sp.]|nr:MAG: hypothetical protein C5S41_07455 [ANME-2 cluster archaeon]